MPALEALVDRFAHEAHTVLVAVSVDSRFSHANWAWDLGGISFPILADFNPRGVVGARYGLYLAEKGFNDRATVIVDAQGIVRYARSVTPAGRRDASRFLALAQGVARDHPIAPPPAPPPVRPTLAPDATLYVRDVVCAAVLRAATNLHCLAALRVRDVVRDPAARRGLDALAGPGAKVPVLVQRGTALPESAAIILALAAGYERS